MGNILLGVTGGIAAYKACHLLRLLKKDGYTVHTALTAKAREFVTPLSLEVLSSNPVYYDDSAMPLSHISLAEKADLALLAPATANTIAKIALGLADNALTTLFLAIPTKKLMIFPAMNTAMYHNPAVQAHLTLLKDRGAFVGETEIGELACGSVGEGRLLPPEEICSLVRTRLNTLKGNDFLKGRTVLISAGPTREKIDPVRYISNRSSGRMGYALAAEAQAAGAKVTLVSGPVALKSPVKDTVYVESTADMREAMLKHAKDADMIFMAAAAADFTVTNAADKKIKKEKAEGLTLKLAKNPDILRELAAEKRTGQVVIGFAAETDDPEKNAAEKLERKKLDMLVLNDVGRSDIGFDSSENEVTIFFKDKPPKFIKKAPKEEVARRILKTCSLLRG